MDIATVAMYANELAAGGNVDGAKRVVCAYLGGRAAHIAALSSLLQHAELSKVAYHLNQAAVELDICGDRIREAL